MPSPLDLSPGDSLGPFHLGSLLFNVLNHIRSHRSVYPAAKLAWDDDSPSSSPIHLILSSPPLHLTFCPLEQRLCRIEVGSASPGSWVSYRGKRLKDARDDEEDLVKTVRRVLGPTYGSSQGTGGASGEKEMLSYPGVAFGVVKDGAGGSSLSRIVLTPLPAPPNVPVDQAWLHPALPDSPSAANGDLSVAEILLDSSRKPSAVILHFHSSPEGSINPIELRIGSTTSEDVLCELSSAVRSFWKEDDRMSIHNASAPSPSSSDPSMALNPYFLSYPHLGLTLLVSPPQSPSSAPHLLTKIILHSNLPGEVNFGRNARCAWRLASQGQEGEAGRGVGVEDGFETVREMLKPSGSSNRSVNGRGAPPSPYVAPVPTGGLRPKTKLANGRKPSAREKEVDLLGLSLNLEDSIRSGASGSSGRGSAEGGDAAEVDEEERPMILDRTADGGEGCIKGKTTEIHGFPGIALEVTGSGDIETVWLF
ncbi:SPOSA6832_01637 [Sporobolomyces salmonicolor]|uniref:SPOSA6832_01637-mRNA-1:cds n=1 Tax=Sporidiobolus salmonicolor TaxID=5005 RepID=A0A0D6EKA4_SPOSA|nr:SPOSA6832_01637 [Sporobolomyces salmonicolor]